MARIGIDLGGTKIEAAVLAKDGCIIHRERIPTPGDYAGKLSAIRTLVTAAEDAQGLHRAPVGVGHPGSHNPRTGLIRNANSTDLNGRALNADLCAALDRPVRCANDANCFALSEALDGAGAGAASVFGVILGTGVGAGLVLNGALHAGHDGTAGEWGHMGLPWPSPEETPSPTCKCGKLGCVEAWCSGPGMAADHARTTGEPLTAKEIADRAQAGDRLARATLERHAGRLARALANVVNLIDPEIIVLGGGLSKLPGLAGALRRKLSDWAFTDEVMTKIVVNHHGDSSGVRGAAWLWPPQDHGP